MITIKTIEQLSSYKKLNKIQKTLVKKSANVKELNHCNLVIKNIGYKKWLSQNNTYYLNKLILKELHNER